MINGLEDTITKSLRDSQRAKRMLCLLIAAETYPPMSNISKEERKVKR